MEINIGHLHFLFFEFTADEAFFQKWKLKFLLLVHTDSKVRPIWKLGCETKTQERLIKNWLGTSNLPICIADMVNLGFLGFRKHKNTPQEVFCVLPWDREIWGKIYVSQQNRETWLVWQSQEKKPIIHIALLLAQ